jgi:hypothetical protein
MPIRHGGRRFEERHHLAAAELPPDDDLLGRINAEYLEHVLGEIQTNRGNLHVDAPSCDSSNNDHPMALRCRERAPFTTSNPDITPMVRAVEGQTLWVAAP